MRTAITQEPSYFCHITSQNIAKLSYIESKKLSKYLLTMHWALLTYNRLKNSSNSDEDEEDMKGITITHPVRGGQKRSSHRMAPWLAHLVFFFI
jgi:hypothetical protein